VAREDGGPPKRRLKKIPVLIRQIPKERQLEISLIENLHREDLNPLEIARVFERLIRELGIRRKRSPTVSAKTDICHHSLRLLNLPEIVQGYLIENQISMGHARALLALEGRSHRFRLPEIVHKN